ncbi:carbohydrate ABC transporter permease [Patescibacteria group bacterium]|nr:carbohydrate ABC transporter permease [Patescibacteria group bacterium]
MIEFQKKTGTILLAICTIFVIFPILWIIITSFKYFRDIMSESLLFTPTFINYIRLFREGDFLKFLLNSVVVSTSATFITVSIAALASYTFSKFKFFGGLDKYILGWLLFVRMIIPISLAIPFFVIMKALNILDNYLALILAYTAINIPFGMWMLKDFFDTVPEELIDAARIDGCSDFKAFMKIALPLIAPGLAATAIFIFILNWNEFLLALILTSSPKSMTIPVGMARLSQQYFIKWGEMSAAAAIFVIPVLIFALLAQKHLVRGLTFGALKG